MFYVNSLGFSGCLATTIVSLLEKQFGGAWLWFAATVYLFLNLVAIGLPEQGD